MATRSITHIHEMDSLNGNKIVCSFYRHFDGYPEGHGLELAEWLDGKRLVNGVGSGFEKGRDFNRAGQMAVQLMADLQRETSIEAVPTDGAIEEFTYHVYYRDAGGLASHHFFIAVSAYGIHFGCAADAFAEAAPKAFEEAD